ncbi:MAG: M1 family aminopeptidase [Bdellovibrionota bacterium]
MNRKKRMDTNDILNSFKKLAINTQEYTVTMHHCQDTKFVILSRENVGFGKEKIIKAIEKSWPIYVSLFGNKVSSAGICDFKAPIGGGPLGEPFLIGLYSTNDISTEVQRFIKSVTGWEEHSSTFEYLNTYYAEYGNPIEAYIDDVVFHELGHLFFGFGVTHTDFENISESWFPLGLGITYDRIIWQKYYTGYGPIISSMVNLWREIYSKNKNIDQKLINPNISNDKEFGLDRLQVYSHGKSFCFLNKLREVIGYEIFDKIVNCLIQENSSLHLTYQKFRTSIDSDQTLKKLLDKTEQEYEIK